MGTEVLHPQDCFMQRLRSVPSVSSRRNAKSYRKPTRRPPHSDPNRKSPIFEDPSSRSSGSSLNQNLVMGQVTILKRGESLDSRRSQDLKKSVSLNEADLVVFGSERLGPDPQLVPNQIGLARSGSDGYAGPAFSQSPSPSSLPFPSFSTRRFSEAVVDSATKDLRRLLRLD